MAICAHYTLSSHTMHGFIASVMPYIQIYIYFTFFHPHHIAHHSVYIITPHRNFAQLIYLQIIPFSIVYAHHVKKSPGKRYPLPGRLLTLTILNYLIACFLFRGFLQSKLITQMSLLLDFISFYMINQEFTCHHAKLSRIKLK